MSYRNLTASDVVNTIQHQNTQVAAGQIGQAPVPQGQVFQLTMSTMGRLADVEQFAADCRFGDCTHVHEPECAVLAAVETGELPHERLHSWRKLQRELRAIAMRHDVRLRKEETRKWKLRTREGRARARPR